MYVEDMVQVCNYLLCRRRLDAAASWGFAVDASRTSDDARIKIRLNSMDGEQPSLNINYDEEYNDDEPEEEEGEEEEEIPSGPSRDWLQLGRAALPPPPDNAVKRQQALRELDFFPDRASSSSSSFAAVPVIQSFPPPPVPWGMRWSSSISTRASPGGCDSNIIGQSQLGRLKAAAQPAEACGSIRVVSPPRSRPTGVWLVLEAAKDLGRQPLLPQIPNNYLWIKDGRLSVELLMKYLVKKLGLEDLSEVEITCRGQQLHPCLSLQYVRDSVWCSSSAIGWNWMIIEHVVMRLLYRRSSACRLLGLDRVIN